MATATLTTARGVLRHSPWDALLLALAAAHGALLLAVPAAPVVALGLWWNSNTVAHYFVHKPFFRPRPLNVLFSLYLSALLGVPQTLWRDRHLAHHAGVAWRLRPSPLLLGETLLVLGLWSFLLVKAPWFFLTAYLPGYAVGLCLCYLHGYYEHARGTTSHYGLLYNVLFLNDGYHVEHHAHPGEHWTRLPRRVRAGADVSRWPAVLRWLDRPLLDVLESWALRCGPLQRFLLVRHESAFRRLLPPLPDGARVGIVGGGLFPRTLLVLRRLAPRARFVIIDRSPESLEAARPFLPGDVEVVNRSYDPEGDGPFDLLVIPLAYVGDREAIYRRPPAPLVFVHDWLWRRRGAGAVVSLFLLKRLNLVRP